MFQSPRPLARAALSALAGLVAVGACGGVIEDGLVVDVELTSPASPHATDGTLLLSTSGVELVPCDGASPLDRFRATVASALAPRAHAHLLETELRIGTAIVEDLLAGEPTAYGRLRPLPDAYCAVRVWLLPADDDAVGLERFPHALGAVAEWQPAAGDGASTRATRAFDRSIPLPGAPVRLGPRERWTLTVHRATAPALERLQRAEAHDDDDHDDDARSTDLLLTLADSIQIHLTQETP